MTDTTKTILLLGVTGGVGADAARLMMAQGYHVIATCRQASQQTSLVSDGLCHKAIILDLAKIDTIQNAFASLPELGITQLDAIVNCAAILIANPLETVELSEVERIFQANVYGTLKVVQLAIPLLRPRKGRIVLVGSLSGSFVMPMTGIYSASKFALEAMCDGMRRELYPWGIKVSLIKPGAIDTKMFRGHLDHVQEELDALSGPNSTLYRPLFEAHANSIPLTLKTAVSSEQVASYVVKALTAARPAARYYPSMESKLVRYLTPLMPDSWLDWFAAKVFPLK